MLSRALILLLIVLNLGVAAWWAFAPKTTPNVAVPTTTTTTPRLQMLGEVPARSRPVPVAPMPIASPPAASATVAAPAPAPAPAPAVLQCWRLGPFTDVAALSRAQAWLQPRVTRSAIVTLPATGRGWRVWLPPLADHDTALAMAQQIVAAGFDDFYVVPDGVEANSIALGRYGNEDAAQHRQGALQAAGFGAKAEALGASTQWLEVVATPAFEPAAARIATAAPQARPLDCALLH